jgi:sugar lactone lactonase YvrE
MIRRIAIPGVVAVFCALAGPATAARVREPLTVRLFARVPAPGLPEGIAVDRQRHRVYVGTSPKDPGPNPPPSKVFAFSIHGRPKDQWTIRGQDLSNPSYGLYGISLDRDGRLYIADFAPPRVIRLNPRTGRQVDYARLPDVPPCAAALGSEQCSAAPDDRAPFPNYPTFAPDGAMYITDTTQALIWRVPPGGGTASVWFSDPSLDSVFGPDGAQVTPDRRTLMFAMATPGPLAPAGLYTIRILPDGSAGKLKPLWQAPFGEFLDGFAFGRSGKIYETLNNGLVILSPDGQVVANVPMQQPGQAVPFDAPANVAFLGKRALVTNHAWITRDARDYAVLDLFAGERGARPFRPAEPHAPAVEGR